VLNAFVIHICLKLHARRAKQLQMPTQFTERMTTVLQETADLTKLMRNISSLAIFVSPLLMLYPKKLEAISLRRDALIAVRLDGFIVYQHFLTKCL
jgi:hypothetical protein